ncbi:hypothetical protein [Acinetobacter sp. HY1485]|uniref:hypothetical protein n=1 Tax=Acinetobacter sp. HY1485 TaxID=2970918 RepID=UPI0022B964CD|nr:hypothetical protein [Acinetobacter sp. HY1485]
MSITVFFKKNATDKSDVRHHRVVCGNCGNESSYSAPRENIDPKKFHTWVHGRQNGKASFKVGHQCLECRHEDGDVCFMPESVKDI